MSINRSVRFSRVFWALAYGGACHLAFALGGAAMVFGLYTGLTQTFGNIPWPWAIAANALLLIQFPLAHSLLLTRPGRSILAKLGPKPYGQTLATTTYSLIASIQLLALFTLWTPSELVVWQAEGGIMWIMTALFVLSWLLLAKASFDAGPELQSGALGWIALIRNRAPKFPDMPERGLFRLIRQPIYASFALTLWTMPTWTVDQVAIAIPLTLYCIIAPRLKERRFNAIYGDRFAEYTAGTPYMIPGAKR